MEALADQVFKLYTSLATTPAVARERLHDRLGHDPTKEETAELIDAASRLDDFEISPDQSELVKSMLDMSMAMWPHLLRRQYIVMRFPEPGLVLCDRPLVLLQQSENRQAGMGLGVINADEILLPLDRRSAMILHRDPGLGERVMNAPDGFTVDDFNQHVVMNAAVEVYCHPDDGDRLDRLTFPTPDQPLLQMNGGSWIQSSVDGVNATPKRKRARRYRGKR
jgi:hypothetical protein